MAETFHTNIVNITEMFTRKTRVKVTAKSIRERLTENPYFPSLYALSNVLDRLHIDNTALKVEKESIDSLQTPFITYLDNQPTGKDFATIVSVTPERITYYAENKKAMTVSRDNFEKNWLGIVLLAQPDEQSGEADYANKKKIEMAGRRREKAIITGALAILLLAVFSFLSPLGYPALLPASLMLLTKSVGLTAAVLLLIYEIDKSNAFVKNICTAGRHTNCDAVLRSSASKFMGMRWSEIGFFYFASTFLFLLLPGIDFAAKASVLAIANLVAVPYVLFSIYYQWRVVKQ